MTGWLRAEKQKRMTCTDLEPDQRFRRLALRGRTASIKGVVAIPYEEGLSACSGAGLSSALASHEALKQIRLKGCPLGDEEAFGPLSVVGRSAGMTMI